MRRGARRGRPMAHGRMTSDMADGRAGPGLASGAAPAHMCTIQARFLVRFLARFLSCFTV